jgi:hypothetical protein
MADAPLRAEMLLAREVSGERRHDLVTELTGLGVEVRARRALDHRGPDDLQWVVLVSLPLQAFLSGIGTEAVHDSYLALKRLVGRATRRRDAMSAEDIRPLVLHDQRSGLRIVLEPGLPNEAYEKLFALDLAAFRMGPLHFDREQRRWRSELDEASGSGES